MKRYGNLLFAILFTALFCLCIFSCKKEEEEEEILEDMSGEVEFSIPHYVLKGEVVTMEAYGILDPQDAQYRWYVSGLYEDSLKSAKVTVRFPDSIGTFTVTAVAYDIHDEYYISSTRQDVKTIDTTFNTSLTSVERSPYAFTDERDGKIYHYVTVGSLDWFTQNLAYEECGTSYMFSPMTSSLFGCLYDWESATGGESAEGLGCGPRGACPEGWTVPTNEDWEDLAYAVSGQYLSFDDAWKGVGQKLSADARFLGERMWPYCPDNLHTNDYGWNALPVGSFIESSSSFTNDNAYGFWWSSSAKDKERAYYRYMYSDMDSFPMGFTLKSDFATSVRCVRMHQQSL